MDTTRQLLETLERLQEANPTWQFGQLVANMALFARGPAKSSVYEDDAAGYCSLVSLCVSADCIFGLRRLLR